MHRVGILNQIPPAEPTDYSESMDQAGCRVCPFEEKPVQRTASEATHNRHVTEQCHLQLQRCRPVRHFLDAERLQDRGHRHARRPPTGITCTSLTGAFSFAGGTSRNSTCTLSLAAITSKTLPAAGPSSRRVEASCAKSNNKRSPPHYRVHPTPAHSTQALHSWEASSSSDPRPSSSAAEHRRIQTPTWSHRCCG